jgi:excisionase family DNA binding protein
MAQCEAVQHSTADHGRESANSEPEFLTARETANFLRLSMPKVYRLIAAGQLPVVRGFGRSIRINRAALLETIAANTERPEGGDL